MVVNLHFADAVTILAVESSKNTCHMFKQSGQFKRQTIVEIIRNSGRIF